MGRGLNAHAPASRFKIEKGHADWLSLNAENGNGEI